MYAIRSYYATRKQSLGGVAAVLHAGHDLHFLAGEAHRLAPSGGDLVADLDMFLSGKRFFDYTTDWRSNGYEPNFRWTKPSIAIVGEAQYSDGHCFAFAYQYMKIRNNFV